MTQRGGAIASFGGGAAQNGPDPARGRRDVLEVLFSTGNQLDPYGTRVTLEGHHGMHRLVTSGFDRYCAAVDQYLQLLGRPAPEVR